MSKNTLLEIRDLRANIAGKEILKGLSLTINEGETHAIMGPNGSGKSTLFDCCTGLTRPDEGSVLLDGQDVGRWSQHRIATEGRLRRSFQRNVVFGSMSVEENLLLAGQAQAIRSMPHAFLNGSASRRAMTAIGARAEELLALVDLARVRRLPASELSVGQQKLLQFAAALMPSPRVLLLDEPFAGVNPILIDRLASSVRWANEQLGATIVVIEHNIEELFSLCRRIVAMNAGELIADGSPDAVAADERVVKAYLGV